MLWQGRGQILQGQTKQGKEPVLNVINKETIAMCLTQGASPTISADQTPESSLSSFVARGGYTRWGSKAVLDSRRVVRKS